MNVLFFSDCRDYGGHEVMAAEAARFIVEGDRLSFMMFRGNPRLRARISQIAGVNIQLHDYVSSRLQEIRSFVSLRARRDLARHMARLCPDLIVVIQGRIELGSIGLLAARSVGARIVSYLPLAHSLSLAGNPMGARARDWIDRYYYAIPDRFITVSESMKALIKSHGVTAPISVAHNGIDLSKHSIISKREARDRLSLPLDRFVLTLSGRVVYRQKGQDFVVEAMQRHRDLLDGLHLVILGDGPDLADLRQRVVSAGLTRDITILPWTDQVSAVYCASDALLIASRFEGVPIVMLEGMYHRLPIIATRVDAMAEVLPDRWTFAPGDHLGFCRAVRSVRMGSDATTVDALHRRVTEELTLDNFGRQFRQALREP